MEITSFVLGVCTVIVIAMVVGTFVNYMSVKQLKEHLDTLDRDIHTEVQILNQNLESESTNLINYVDNLNNNNQDNMNEIYRYIDSRFDKMENKFRADVASGTEVLKVIEDNKLVKARLDEFIKTYQNQ